MDQCMKTLVAVNGQGGFDSYRVPGIAVAPDGDILRGPAGGPARPPAPAPPGRRQDLWPAADAPGTGGR